MSETPTADTANYFSVAVHDDEKYASGSSTPAAQGVGTKEDRAARKARRIAEAVERSKVEYTAENVYTERGWFMKHDDRGVSKSKIDQQRLEFLTASLYYSPNPDHQEILATIQHAFNGETRPTAFPKELLDIGIRSALALGDTASAAKLARSGYSSWRSQWAGAACSAYDALIADDPGVLRVETVMPNFSCLSVGGPQLPLLTRLADYLERKRQQQSPPQHETPQAEQVVLLRDKVDDLICKKRAAATRPMFTDEDAGADAQGANGEAPSSSVTTMKCPERPSIDPTRLAKELGLGEEHRELLEAAVRKLEKATRSADEPPSIQREDRGVREL